MNKEEILTHAQAKDAMATVLEAIGKFIVKEKEFILKQGESIIMPKDVPHSVYGIEGFKMQLIVSY